MKISRSDFAKVRAVISDHFSETPFSEKIGKQEEVLKAIGYETDHEYHCTFVGSADVPFLYKEIILGLEDDEKGLEFLENFDGKLSIEEKQRLADWFMNVSWTGEFGVVKVGKLICDGAKLFVFVYGTGGGCDYEEELLGIYLSIEDGHRAIAGEGVVLDGYGVDDAV